jgi:epoxyqueuosine reductase
LVDRIRAWAHGLGFSQIGISSIDLSDAEPGLLEWLNAGFHGDMAYMAAHGLRRARPAELVPGTLSVITARMDYLPRHTPQSVPNPAPEGKPTEATDSTDATDWAAQELQRLQRPTEAVVSVYARGRDYHKVLRQRLQKLCEQISVAVGPFGHRVFTDSAPVLEVALATRSGIGWRGKHTLALHRNAGSMFFLGEVYTSLALPPTPPITAHCGECSACITACPTGAIVAPYRLDARRCISYLTIEHAGPIPVQWRAAMGNRIYGCDDCQLVCPWNKFAKRSPLPDFDAREGLYGGLLAELFAWSPEEFARRTEGSAIRRIGHERWLRNLAVALGNALRSGLPVAEAQRVQQVLAQASQHPSELLREHVAWALAQEPLAS